MSAKQEPSHVLVIGAGSTGLLIAQGLKKAGISYRVYERTDASTYEHRQRDWTMALHWGADAMATCLTPEMLAGVKIAQTDPYIELTEDERGRVPIYDGKTGEILAMPPIDAITRASREKLRKYLSKGLDVEFGKKIVGITHDEATDKVTASFEDGTTAVGDALVGADSASSFVRHWLLPNGEAELTTLPVVGYNFTSTYTAEQAKQIRYALHPLWEIGIHPDHPYMGVFATTDIPDPDDPTTWVFQTWLSEWTDERTVPESSADRLADVKRIASTFCDPWKTSTLALDDEKYIHKDNVKTWAEPVAWDNHGGRITLAGDAAHAISPYRGQGLNNGLLDAANYVQALITALKPQDNTPGPTTSLREAVDDYDAEVLERGRTEIKISLLQTKMTHYVKLFANSPMGKFGAQRLKQWQEEPQV